MYLSHSGELPWTCERCRYRTNDPSDYEGTSAKQNVALMLRATGESDHESISTLRSIDDLFSRFTVVEMAKQLRSASGLCVGPLPLWRANKIRYELKDAPLISVTVVKT